MKMEQIENRTLATFSHRDYIIEIFDEGECFDAYLSRDGYGVKTYLFAVSKKKTPFSEFIKLVDANLEEYEIDYEEGNL